ncbi:MAG: hypothetical protein HY681_10720 [Chloroflexi bacterium]|nr:hypothetical protein [Chloroflexota bacterium]
MWAIFVIPATGLSLFVSSWLLMIFWGILAPDLGIKTIGYLRAVATTVALWIVVAPLVGAIVRARVSWTRWPRRNRNTA